MDVPSEAQEDRLWIGRELRHLKKEHAKHYTQIRSLLRLQGIGQVKIGGDFIEALDCMRCSNGAALPVYLRAEPEREFERLQMVIAHKQELRQEYERQVRQEQPNDHTNG